MPQQDYLELARTYVARSNAHDLSAILPMFDSGAVYRSSRVGEHVGREAIGAMMGSFFERFPDVVWKVPTYGETGPRTIGFGFVMRATDQDSGESIKVHGHERIEFTRDGLIDAIDVAT
ncbi:MAG: nuclear transport factor 2 family protein [Alphaproteobacteria bacterium]|nr:nuclear transport factor 2 family protein [Alphaproteobacteria bacterium]